MIRMGVVLVIVALAASPIQARAKSETACRSGAVPASPMAVIGNVSVSSTELDALVGNKLARLRTEEYNVRRRVLEDRIATVLLEREAKARGISVDELIRLEVSEKVAVIPAVARETLDGPKQTSEASSGLIVSKPADSGLQRERLRRRRLEFLKELRSKANVMVLLEAPRQNVNESNSPSRGSSTAPVTIVEFIDYQCPFCAREVSTLKRVEDNYRGKVRIVVRDFPLPGHSEAPKAAEAAACAAQQGKFWEMHDRLFSSGAALGVEQLRGLAQVIALDTDEFNTCVDSGRFASKWRTDQEEGIAYGVGGTPTMFVNGRMVSGVVSYEALVEVIEDGDCPLGHSEPGTSRN